MTDHEERAVTDTNGYDGPEWDELSQLFGAYLHQDWQDEYDDVWDAVRDFRSGTSALRVAAAADQVRRILDVNREEARLDAIIGRLGIEYDPPKDGWTYLGWLTELEKVLRSGADT
jgi:hypothetical protein